METKNLRLGNWLVYEGWHNNGSDRYFMVRNLSYKDDKIELTDGIIRTHVAVDSVKPIPITEKWLKNFGFEYDKETSTWSLQINLEKFDYVFEIEYVQGEAFVIINNVEWNYTYAHELQNLIFGITRFELKTNIKGKFIKL